MAVQMYGIRSAVHAGARAVAIGIVLASDAWAQESGVAPAPGLGAKLFSMLPMFLMVYLIFYVLVISPKQKGDRSQREFVEGLKKGDAIVTSSGLFGKVVGLDERAIQLEIAPSVRVRVERSAVVKRESQEAAS